MILDTRALSAVAEGDPAAVVAFSRADRPSLPVIVLGEFRYGIARSRRRSEYEEWLEEMIAATRVLVIDDETAGPAACST